MQNSWIPSAVTLSGGYACYGDEWHELKKLTGLNDDILEKLLFITSLILYSYALIILTVAAIIGRVELTGNEKNSFLYLVWTKYITSGNSNVWICLECINWSVFSIPLYSPWDLPETEAWFQWENLWPNHADIYNN